MTAQIVAYTLNHFGSLCVCSYRNGFACEKYRPFDKETGQPKDRSAMSIFWQRTHKALFQFINIISFNRWYRKTRAVPATRPPDMFYRVICRLSHFSVLSLKIMQTFQRRIFAPGTIFMLELCAEKHTHTTFDYLTEHGLELLSTNSLEIHWI